MRDPYTVLGVPKSAPAAEIKKAYRRLAKKFHPDQSTEPKAKDKFAEIGSAYEIVGDEKKRAQFDRGEIDAEGKPKFQGFDGFAGGASRPAAGGAAGFDNFEFNFGAGKGAGRPGGGHGFDAADVFADLFGGAARGGRTGGFGQQPQAPLGKGEDVQASVVISLAESVHGTKARISLPTGRDLEINVPAGIEDSKQIRLKGQGQPGRGGAGDAIVTVRIARHPTFRIDGSDVRLDLPITLYEAVLGGRVNVPTLEGLVEMGIPPSTNGGRTMRLRGKGLVTPAKTRGDLLVTLRIVLPDEAKDELAALAKDLAAKHPYDPRKAIG